MPPSNTEEVGWGFPTSTQIIVENGFHETLPDRRVQEIVVDFFNRLDVRAEGLILERPAFLSSNRPKARRPAFKTTLETFHRITAPGLTFKVQAAAWLESLRTRRRKPLKPASIHNWEHMLNKRLLAQLGDVPLSDLGNSVLRTLVDKLVAEKLSAKTIVHYVQCSKLVVASAVNSEGDLLYPRKWNDEFIGVPIVRPEEQRRPRVTAEEVTDIVDHFHGRYRVLYAVLGGSGVRIDEALALKPESLSSDCKIIYIRRSIYRGKEQEPKTRASIRDIDIAEPLAGMLREYIANKPAGSHLFATASGRPMSQRSVLRMLHSQHKKGFHAFRRFRTALLRKARVPEDLIRFWIGHASRSMTDEYARQIREDVAFRQKWATEVGLGFSLSCPEVGLHWATEIVATHISDAT